MAGGELAVGHRRLTSAEALAALGLTLAQQRHDVDVAICGGDATATALLDEKLARTRLTLAQAVRYGGVRTVCAEVRALCEEQRARIDDRQRRPRIEKWVRGDELDALRREVLTWLTTGFTKSDLARRAGLVQPNYVDRVLVQNKISIWTALKISAVLQISLPAESGG
jgi:hypothetical protein